MRMNILSRVRHRISPASPRTFTLTLALALLAILGACESGSDLLGPTETASVRILLTDAPSDMLTSAEVWISRVYLQGGGDDDDLEDDDSDDDDGGRVDLFNDPDNPILLDLLQLQNGVTADLTGLVEVDATAYQGLRLVVDSTRVVLADGYTFQDGSTEGTFRIPSGGTSGIKVQTLGAIDLEGDEIVTITVDFPVDENFVIQMMPQSETVIRRILFTPVLRELDRSREDDDDDGDEGDDA